MDGTVYLLKESATLPLDESNYPLLEGRDQNSPATSLDSSWGNSLIFEAIQIVLLKITSLLRPSWRYLRYLSHIFPKATAIRFCLQYLSPILPPPIKTIKSTTFLDGIRGVAAFIVTMHHYLPQYFGWGLWGYTGEPPNNHILQLPFFRVLYTGTGMTSIFFVLSGFVLSIGPLRRIRAHDHAKLLSSLSSSVFRRGMRLYLPLIPATFVASVLGYYNQNYVYDGAQMGTKPSGHADTFINQMLVMIREIGEKIINPFTWHSVGPTYMGALWTMPVEFRGSIVVFLSLLAFANARTSMRMIATSLFACYSMYRLEWTVCCFLSGTVLAEWHLIRQEANLAFDVETSAAACYSIRQKSTWTAVLILGLYLVAWPQLVALPRIPTNDKQSWGYATLATLLGDHVDRDRLASSTGAIFIIVAIDNFQPFQRPFTSPFIQYLGRISFSEYILHGPWQSTINHHLTFGMIALTGSTAVGWCLSMIVSIPMLWLVATVYWRYVDEKSVELAKRLYEIIL